MRDGEEVKEGEGGGGVERKRRRPHLLSKTVNPFKASEKTKGSIFFT